MKKEYRLVEEIDYAGQVKRKVRPKGDIEKAIKSLADSNRDRDARLAMFSESTAAYRRTVGTTYRIEIREVTDWRTAGE